MRLKIALWGIILLFSKSAWPQANGFVKIKGLPTEELYNLFIDSKGFLWIGHDLGISRYDGISFTSYSSPDQTTLSMTDIVEDKQGRIWCHNFSGQIFYIEQNTMHLLKAYDYRKETAFPRILLYHNTLVASSDRGLFICNTANLSCRYMKCANATASTISSITVINNTVVGYGDGNWFTYRDNGPLKRTTISGDTGRYTSDNYSTLNISAFNDTAFMFSNPTGILNKITIHGDKLKLEKKIPAGNFINTISVDQKTVWVNTIRKSFLLGDDKKQVGGDDLSSIITDNEGNTWFSSLKKGLGVKYNGRYGNLKPLHLVKADNMLKCTDLNGDILVAGTQNGSIVLYNLKRGQILPEINLPGNPGSVNYLYHLHDSKYLVGTSINTYEIDLQTHNIQLYPEIRALKQADQSVKFVFTASTAGLNLLPLTDSKSTINFAENNFRELKLKQSKGYALWGNTKRTRAVCYYPVTQTIFAAFKDGVYTIDRNGTRPFTYHGIIVHASCLKYINHKIVIGTISNGLLITDGITTSNVTVNEGLSSNSILNLKSTENWLWIVSAGAPKIIDVKDWAFVSFPNLSALSETPLLAVEKSGQQAYLVTPEGLLVLPVTKPAKTIRLTNYLDDIMVNNHPILKDTAPRFSYSQNNIRFNIGVPFYYHSNEIYLKYLLKGATSQSWLTTRPGERIVNFSALSPGKYKFTVLAVHPLYGMAVSPVVYNFSIGELWWQTWFFKVLALLIITGLTYYIVATYFLNRLRTQKANYDKQLSIQRERQRISSEMHDDVGAGLSAIKIFLDIAANKREPGDIVHISEMINDTSDKIHDIIWGTNPENDTLESLLYYLQFQALKLFKHTGQHFEAIIPQTIPQMEIPGEKRQNIYLITKEFLHNALKHSKASVVRLEIRIDDNEMRVEIKDNGTGISQANKTPNGTGMKNAAKRIQEIKGKMTVQSDTNGTTVYLVIPLV
jgi:hypothetical protein